MEHGTCGMAIVYWDCEGCLAVICVWPDNSQSHVRAQFHLEQQIQDCRAGSSFGTYETGTSITSGLAHTQPLPTRYARKDSNSCGTNWCIDIKISRCHVFRETFKENVAKGILDF